MMDEAVLRCVERSVLCWLATADAEGRPSVSPKEIFAARGATQLVIANIASPGSVRNIRKNPNVCVSVIDVFRQKGYKLLGRAENVLRSDSRFDSLCEPLVVMTKGLFPIHSVIEVEVTQVAPILAPSYRLVPGTTEEGQVEAALRAYGVRARSPRTD